MVPEHVRGVRGVRGGDGVSGPQARSLVAPQGGGGGAPGRGVARALGGAVFGPLGPFPGPFPCGGPR